MYEVPNKPRRQGKKSKINKMCSTIIRHIESNKISKRPPISISSSSWCQKWHGKITPHLNLFNEFKSRVNFCYRFWHWLKDEIKIGGLFKIFLPLTH